ncbi:hypothetical protein L0Z64_19360 (plasmid) [Phaeobacter sp. BS23]|uniref:hypothetical protein n=1 Tax=Phaeobacter sp. BS23 TaxID=2907239 RepID=UPI0037042667
MNIGLSYSTQPQMTSTEFLAFCDKLGVLLTDLRPDHGQVWEASPGDPFSAAGMVVMSLNTRIILGQGNALDVLENLASARRIQHRFLRVFLAKGATNTEVARDIAALADAGYDSALLAIETHDGFAGVGRIAEIAERHMTPVIFDTLGLWKISGLDHIAQIEALAGRAVAAHVKGFDVRPDGTTPHTAIGSGNWQWTTRVLRLLPKSCPIIIETRHHDIQGDIQTLQGDWKDT